MPVAFIVAWVCVWIAPAHAVEVGDISINEVLAANATVLADEAGEFDDWIELTNRSMTYVDLGGLFLSDDPVFPQKWEIPSVVIGPGEYLLVWADDDELQGEFHANFKLNAQGEEVLLYDSVAGGNDLLDRVVYGLQSQDVSFGRLSGGAQQEPDYLTPATPSASNSGAALFADVCINEFLTTSSGGGIDDWVELYNRGTDTLDLSGWGVSDDRALPMKYVIPPGVELGAGAFLFIDETVLGFSFSSLGEEIMITGSDGATGYDYHEFGPQVPDVTVGRFRDGETRWFSLPPTPGATNGSPTIDVETSSAVVSAAPVVNPARFGAAVTFSIAREERIAVSVFDSTGRRVRRVFSEFRAAGTHTIAWDGRTDSGAAVASGRFWMVIDHAGGATSVPVTLVR